MEEAGGTKIVYAAGLFGEHTKKLEMRGKVNLYRFK